MLADVVAKDLGQTFSVKAPQEGPNVFTDLCLARVAFQPDGGTFERPNPLYGDSPRDDTNLEFPRGALGC